MVVFGSPPRPWGRRTIARSTRSRVRFTPTPVGTTWKSPHQRPISSVHPHARGDDLSPLEHAKAVLGSPPRPWGRLRGESASTMRFLRFTPTPVGTTRDVQFEAPAGAVHPHARGDDTEDSTLMLPLPGSPPRPWGRQRDLAGAELGLRFTPTPVGTTGLPAGSS